MSILLSSVVNNTNLCCLIFFENFHIFIQTMKFLQDERTIFYIASTIYQLKKLRNKLIKLNSKFSLLKEKIVHFILAKEYLKKLPYLYLLLFLYGVYFIGDYLTLNSPVERVTSSKYNIFSAEPLTIEATTTYLYGMDSRAKKVDGVFRAYGCPMYGTGEYIVEQADKNGIPYWIVASIAFQESLCGKHTPEKGGVESYNSWGWAVYGGNAKFFKSYEHGIKVVSEYLANRFFSRGIVETCDIMRVYTPPSNGSWCRGVNFFAEKIQNYSTR